MRIWPLALLATALGCKDEQLAPYAAALEAYDEGRAALDNGDAPAAAAAFARAAAADPDSVSLPAWQAEALATAGDLDGALAVLDAAVSHSPEEGTIRYNRAALRARGGDLDGAIEDLQILYALGLSSPEEAGDDPDFAALAADPETQRWASPPKVAVSVAGEAGAVLLGGSYTLELIIASRRGVPLVFTDQGQAPGLLKHLRTVEDIEDGSSRAALRRIQVDFRAVSAGQASLGPWLVAAGPASSTSGAAPVEVLALQGPTAAGEADEAGAVGSVEALFLGRDPPWAGRVDGRVLVVTRGGQRATVTPADPQPVALELRRSGQTEQVGQLHRVGGPVQVRIQDGPEVLLDQTVP